MQQQQKKKEEEEEEAAAVEKLFVNIVMSEKIDEPKATSVKGGQQWNVPVSLGPKRFEKDKVGGVSSSRCKEQHELSFFLSFFLSACLLACHFIPLSCLHTHTQIDTPLLLLTNK